MKYVAAVDQGTTSTRCLIFDAQGNIVSSAQKEHQQLYPKPGWVEHDPLEIVMNVNTVLAGALDAARLTANDIVSVGITNQRETTVAWNRETGLPYTNAIVWQDTRTDAICRQLSVKSLASRYKEINGLPIATYFSGPKIRWLIDNLPEISHDLSKGKVCFGTIDSWIVWNLTGGKKSGVFVTDVTNASRTMLFNLRDLDWDEELLRILEIPRDSLPEIKPSSSYFGEICSPFNGVPITGILGDQQSALFGQICFDPGDAKNTYGTGCFMLLNTGNQIVQSDHELLTTVGYQIGDSSPVYCLEGSIAITGALVQWLRDNLGIISQSSDVEDLAKTVEDNGDVYFIPAFSGLFAPYWESSARGLVIGLTRYANKGHLARAALEATAYQTYDVLQAMQKDAGKEINNLKVDGGMVINELLMQFQADVLGCKVIRPTITETTAIGAAYAAGLEVGYWKTLVDLKSNWKTDKTWSPAIDPDNRMRMLERWKEAVGRSFNWV